MIGAVPVQPDADQAREWLRQELAKAAYEQARPSWFDRAASAVWDWVTSLFDAGVAGPPTIVWVVLVLLVVAAIIGSYLIFGPPRRNRRGATVGAIFEDDARPASAMRAAAEAAAAAQDWPLAIEEMFRAIARGLAERAVLDSSPGTTARSFAARAGGHFPSLMPELVSSAADFDDVRYLDRPGGEAAYRAVAALDGRVSAARPVFAEQTAEQAAAR
ncbi:MAG: DUF4129 domain-containing protein [Burkholderiaceae bacterium]|nr:DUF4129 domain-containing protein [Microbacteriaceae bacterium]